MAEEAGSAGTASADVPQTTKTPDGGPAIVVSGPGREHILDLAERSAEIGIWDVDLATNRARGTEQFYRIMGLPFSVEPVPMETFRALRHPEDGKRVLDGFQRAIESRSDTYEMEYRILRPDGQVRWIFGRGRIIRDESGKPVRYAGVDIDITRRKQAELALAESRERLRLAQEAAGIGSWDLDVRTSSLTWSESQWKLYGRGVEQRTVAVADWSQAIHPEDRDKVVSGLRAAIDGGPDYRQEFRIVRRSGEVRWLAGRGATIRDEAGGVLRILGVDVDITAQREAAAVLAEINRTLELRVQERTKELDLEAARRADAEARLRQAQKMEAVGQLTGGIAHDFNNLLTVVIGNLDSAERRLATSGPAVDQRVSHSIAMALTGAKAAAQLTHRLLAFSRRQPLDPRTVDMNDLVMGMKELIQRTLNESVKVETVLGQELWPVLADVNQLESALLNLVLNARDAMPRGGSVRISTLNIGRDDAPQAVEADQSSRREYVVLEISDSGVGIPKENLEKVFEPFFTTKPTGVGSGLGLAMVYGFVHQSGGFVTIDSKLGSGTSVRMYLPRLLQEKHAGRAASPIASPAGTPRALASEELLLVEDNESVRSFAAETLHDLGYKVHAVGDAKAAISFLDSPRNGRIDLLFTDIVLPEGGSGIELAYEARRRIPELAVLLTTGFVPDGMLPEALAASMHFLPKPYQSDSLAAKVRAAIDMARLRRLADAG